MGGIMGIRRAIIPAILALGAAGTILASSVAPAVAVYAPSAQVQSATSSAGTNTLYHT
jgi:hypothetical protein